VSDRDPIVNVRAEEDRSRGVLLKVVRVTFLVLFITVTLLDILSYNKSNPDRNARVFAWPTTVTISLGLAIVVIFADLLTPRKKVSTLFSIFLGLLGAIIGTLAVGQVLDLFWASYAIEDKSLISLLKVLIGLGLAYLAVATVLQTQDDFRLVIPYVEFVKQIRGPRPMILDTSALIDGRVHDLAQTGIVSAPLVVPRFVVDELQALADSSDRLKRGRGRRGLTMIEKLQSAAAIDVMIDDTNLPKMPVDQMLLELARSMPGIIVTTDSGLARVADIQKIPVLNLHDVASAMRPQVIAGESLRVRMMRPGEHDGQAVGYLDDGTMVVVDHAEPFIGEDVDAVVTSTLQTNAGRMIFAKIPQAAPAQPVPAPPLPPTPLAAPAPLATQIPAAPQAAAPAPAAPQVAPETPAERDEEDEGPEPGDASRQPNPSPVKPGPFPIKPPRSIRDGTPRNPRR
jgi:uncharacterized protein YacL